MGYLILNGKNSATIDGLLITKLPPIVKPEMRMQSEVIDGRDGEILSPLGYSSYDKTFEIALCGKFDLDEIVAFFNSSGTVTFSNEEDKYYYYTIYHQIDFENLIRHKTAVVTMRVQPFKFSLVDKFRRFVVNKNLFELSEFEKSSTGLTAKTNKDGTIRLSGKGNYGQTEFFVPIKPVNLGANQFVLRINSSGVLPANVVQMRLIRNNSIHAAYTFGGQALALQSNTTKILNDTFTDTKTFNVLWFSVNYGTAINALLDLTLKTAENKEATIRNTGNIYSKPKLTVYGAGSIELGLNGNFAFKIELGNDNNVTIDVDKMEASKDGVLKNRFVRGDYEKFVLKPGLNKINSKGNVEVMEFENFSRWI